MLANIKCVTSWETSFLPVSASEMGASHQQVARTRAPRGQGTRGRTARAGVLFQKLGRSSDRPWLLLPPAPQPCLLTGKASSQSSSQVARPPPPASPAEFITSSPPDPVPQQGVKQLLVFQARLSFHFVSRASII